MQVTTVVMLELEEYNELRRAETYLRLAEQGYVEIELICWEKHVRIAVPETIVLGQIISACQALFSMDFERPALKNQDGVLLEPLRTLSALGIKFGAKLFFTFN